MTSFSNLTKGDAFISFIQQLFFVLVVQELFSSRFCSTGWDQFSRKSGFWHSTYAHECVHLERESERDRQTDRQTDRQEWAQRQICDKPGNVTEQHQLKTQMTDSDTKNVQYIGKCVWWSTDLNFSENVPYNSSGHPHAYSAALSEKNTGLLTTQPSSVSPSCR